MRVLMGDQCNHFIIFIVLACAAWTSCIVDTSCSKLEKKLWAYTNPTTEHFTDTYRKILSSDRGERCKWIIMSSEADINIKLKLSNFELKNSTNFNRGDCLEIYDGKNDDKRKLEVLCDKVPRDLYTSSGSELLVIYKRGEVEGDRRFSMTYSSHSVMTKGKIIQIAGIIGAVLAGVGLLYVALRVTRCCKCLRKKSNIDNSRAGSTTRERDRLVTNVQQGGDSTGNPQNSDTNQNTAQSLVEPLNSVAALQPTSSDGVAVNSSSVIATTNDNAHDSDVDSLQDMNELPPSYESLYLNELGESVTPPKYSPPPHRSTHPPRRVNTFN